MLAEERLEAIKRELLAHGRVGAGELAGRFGVSEDTVRRDLRELAREGLCRKVYGGALAPLPQQAPQLGSLATRETLGKDEKARLARKAAGLVRAGQTIFMDAGSTNCAIAKALPRDIPLTIATNAPAIATILAGHALARVLLIGGLHLAEAGACVGAGTVDAIRRINADLFFLGSCGLDIERGATAFDQDEADVKRAFAANSRAIAVASMHDKIGTSASFQIIETSAIDHLVLDASCAPGLWHGFANLGLDVHLAEGAS